MLLTPHNEGFAVMAPTNDPVQSIAFSVREQVVQFARKLLAGAYPADFLLVRAGCGGGLCLLHHASFGCFDFVLLYLYEHLERLQKSALFSEVPQARAICSSMRFR